MKSVSQFFLLFLVSLFSISSIGFSIAEKSKQGRPSQQSIEQEIQKIKFNLPQAKWVDLPKEQEVGVKPQYTFEIELPKLGTFILQGNVNIETMDFRFDGSLKEPKSLKLGPLVLYPPKASLSRQAGFQIEGTASLLGLNFTFKLEKFIPGQDVIFSLEGPVPLVIPITPWKNLNLKNYIFLLVYEQKQFLQSPNKCSQLDRLGIFLKRHRFQHFRFKHRFKHH